MSVEMQLVGWWTLFGATHLIGSSVPVRTWLIARMGLIGFKATYSIVSILTFSPLIVTYWNNRHEGAVLFEPTLIHRYLADAGMMFALILLVLGIMTPNPMTTAAEMSGRVSGTARGIQRITRHPLNNAVGMFGIAHCITNPTVGDWIFFGGFLVFSVVTAWHQDRRVWAVGPHEFKAFHAESSFVPFMAILRGYQSLRWREFGAVAVLVAVILFLILRMAHPTLIGGFGG